MQGRRKSVAAFPDLSLQRIEGETVSEGAMALLIFLSTALIDGTAETLSELWELSFRKKAKNGCKFSHKSDYIVDVDIYFLIKFKSFSGPSARTSSEAERRDGFHMNAASRKS